MQNSFSISNLCISIQRSQNTILVIDTPAPKPKAEKKKDYAPYKAKETTGFKLSKIRIDADSVMKRKGTKSKISKSTTDIEDGESSTESVRRMVCMIPRDNQM